MLFDTKYTSLKGSATYRLFSATMGGVTVIGDLLVKFDCADRFCHFAYTVIVWVIHNT